MCGTGSRRMASRLNSTMISKRGSTRRRTRPVLMRFIERLKLGSTCVRIAYFLLNISKAFSADFGKMASDGDSSGPSSYSTLEPQDLRRINCHRRCTDSLIPTTLFGAVTDSCLTNPGPKMQKCLASSPSTSYWVLERSVRPVERRTEADPGDSAVNHHGLKR
jgi:hypothetical protein